MFNSPFRLPHLERYETVQTFADAWIEGERVRGGGRGRGKREGEEGGGRGRGRLDNRVSKYAYANGRFVELEKQNFVRLFFIL